jgi:oligopeptide/dipeptide ABC transporter ATP-binding protein
LAAVPSLPPAREAAAEPLPRGAPMFSAPARVEPTGPALNSESGCAFRDRCAYAAAVCATVVPQLEEVAAGHWVACHRSQEFTAWPTVS